MARFLLGILREQRVFGRLVSPALAHPRRAAVSCALLFVSRPGRGPAAVAGEQPGIVTVLGVFAGSRVASSGRGLSRCTGGIRVGDAAAHGR
jgi:hypothetical protein